MIVHGIDDSVVPFKYTISCFGGCDAMVLVSLFLMMRLEVAGRDAAAIALRKPFETRLLRRNIGGMKMRGQGKLY